MHEENVNYYNKILVGILIKRFPKQDQTPQHIAIVISNAVLNGKIPLGLRLFTQKRLVAALSELNVTPRTLEMAWDILKFKYELISTNGKGGSWIVTALTEQAKTKIKLLNKAPDKNVYKAKFDEETLYGLLKEEKRFSLACKLALSAYEKIQATRQKQKVIPELITELLKLVATRLNYQSSADEILYTDDYEELLIYICEVVLATHNEFIIVKPASAIVQNALGRAKLKVNFVVLDTFEKRMDALENYCLNNEVGIVYLAPTSAYPYTYEITDLMWLRLKEIQKKNPFMIFIDDRCASLKMTDAVFKDISAGNNNGIIYLGPISLLHPKIAVVNFVLGPKALIRKVKRKFNYKTTQVPVSIGYGLLKLMETGELKKYTAIALVAMQRRVMLVKNELLASNLFKEISIHQQQQWFFYLEPKQGCFVVDLEEQFAALNLFIMNVAIFSSKPNYSTGIMISISSFHSDELCLHDLKKLLYHLKKMITNEQ